MTVEADGLLRVDPEEEVALGIVPEGSRDGGVLSGGVAVVVKVSVDPAGTIHGGGGVRTTRRTVGRDVELPVAVPDQVVGVPNAGSEDRQGGIDVVGVIRAVIGVSHPVFYVGAGS